MTTIAHSSLPVPPSVPLAYTIASSTTHSGKYVPENIMVDKPQEQSSRWSGALQGNAADQWIILRLESLSVLEKITFGKFFKPHPCNVKEIKVFAGVTEDHMSEVLHAGLKNDTTAETFNIQHVNSAGVCIPTQFVKVMPMLAHGQNFHTSIWHIAMTGIVDPSYVEEVRGRHNEYRETAVLRHVLKHLRQRRLLTPYQTILSRADTQLEHPLVTQLHESLVLQGDWSRSEQLLDVLSSSGLFDSYLQSCQPHAMWTRLFGTDADGDVPPARGGHAMCIDPVNEMIYIFGGWNGEKSMDDFWVYSIKDDRWQVLSHSTSKEQNAPGARSCHKMVFDMKTGSIYLLGRLNDADGLRAPTPSNARTLAGVPVGAPGLPQQQPQQQQPSTTTATSEETTPPTTFCSEFYRYHTRGVDSGKWDFLAFDTASSGGPPLIFDHQMAMDCEAQILYVFGGRVVDGDWDTSKYSGLYSYNVRQSRWQSLQLPETLSTQGHPIIPPRFGHSMVLDPTLRTLYIFAGQRDDRYLSDMYAYDINTGIAKEIFSNFSSAGGPDACFTQRAVIDPTLKELYVFCGLTRNITTGARNTLRAYLSNWVYRYGTRPGKWTQILRQPDRPASESPLPRFAHQVAYNPFTRSVFLHGGNAGNTNEKGAGLKGGRDADGDGFGFETEDGREAPVAGVKERRLDDFWRMELKRPGPEEIVRQAKFQIRRQQFREMCEEAPPVRALNFLQNEVSSVVDHRNAEETEMFRSLLTHLLAPAPVPPDTTEKTVPTSTSSHHHRHSLSHSSTSSNSTTTTTSLEHRESSSRPRKRSRGDPEEESEGGVWTNEIAEYDSQGFSNGGSTQRLRDMVDPLEALIRGEDEGGGAHPESQSQLTGARYTQRTEVFEHLLKFIADSEKQPSDSLLDLVGGDKHFRSQF